MYNLILEAIEPAKMHLNALFEQSETESVEEINRLTLQRIELNQKIESLEEKYITDNFSKDLYEKYRNKY